MISTHDLYVKLKQNSLSRIGSIGDDYSGATDAFKHNLKVLVELCDKQLYIDNNRDESEAKTHASVEQPISLTDTDARGLKKDSDDDSSDCEPTKKEQTYSNPRHYLDIEIAGRMNWYKCVFDRSVCKKKFNNRLEAIAHVRTHTGRMAYKCANIGCDYRTAKLTKVRNHMKSCDKINDN